MSSPALTSALLTPPGQAGIAVIALAGDAALDALAAVFRPRSGKPILRPLADRIVYGDIVIGGDVVDDVLVCQAADGRIEIHCHGSEAVVRAVLAELQRHRVGVATASPSAPVDPTGNSAPAIAAEVLEALPRVMTWRAAEILAAQAEIGLAAAVRHARDTGCDPAVRPLTIGRRLIEPPKVAIVGRPNVGKSTLANALFGRQRSIVADAPGTTRDYVAEPADVLGFAVWLVDTAGRRTTDDPVEFEGVRRSIQQAASADLVLAVLDGSAPAAPEDEALLDAFASDSRCLWILNKTDRPAAWKPPVSAVSVSAREVIGLDPLRCGILERLGLADLTPQTPVVFTARQERLLRQRDWAGLLSGTAALPG